MKDEARGAERSFDPGDYPALREFFPAYLHQDFGEEHASVGEAVKVFVSEASGDEILQVKEEWKAFRERFKGSALETMRAALERLGGAWRPASEAEMKEVDEILSRAEP